MGQRIRKASSSVAGITVEVLLTDPMFNPLCSTHTSCPLPKSMNPVPRIMTVVASCTGAAFGSISFNETEASSYTVNTSG